MPNPDTVEQNYICIFFNISQFQIKHSNPRGFVQFKNLNNIAHPVRCHMSLYIYMIAYKLKLNTKVDVALKKL